ncbi:hypothetical protein C0431_07820 [bacterium]|nr:hypothetical protein [bacterium]
MHSEFKEMLSLLESEGVEYLVVGGLAYAEYAEPRYTKDIDIWIRIDTRNAQALFAALAKYGAPLDGVKPEDFEVPDRFFQIGVPPIRIDILMGIDGVEFESAWQRRRIRPYEDVNVNYLSKEDLITNKLASGRPQDLVDVDILKQAPEY